jgi:hypothetical protein
MCQLLKTACTASKHPLYNYHHHHHLWHDSPLWATAFLRSLPLVSQITAIAFQLHPPTVQMSISVFSLCVLLPSGFTIKTCFAGCWSFIQIKWSLAQTSLISSLRPTMTFSISEVSWIVFEPSTEKIHTSACHHSVREAAGNISYTMMLSHRTM